LAAAVLVKVMQRLMTGYAVNFNIRHRRVGHLFQNRYKSIVVEEEPYLLELVRYLHLNPLRAHLVTRLGSEAWTSHRTYLGRDQAPPWLSTYLFLDQFGDPDRLHKFVLSVRRGPGSGTWTVRLFYRGLAFRDVLTPRG
jgi:hypothetical protein